MSEENTTSNATPLEENASKNRDNSRLSRFSRNLLAWLKRTVRIHEDTDYEATVNSITSAISFKGINVWILFFAIIVASIGLNVNSTAVIIGAMLISPLMGPIMGIGLAIGTTDNELLRISLRNLMVMVIISLVASTAYFFLSPLGDAQSELLARTRPTIFDVLIAFFGGAAGIVATSRKSQPFTVISGVAIATALMPPLCTAGYGLATAQFKYFFGAFYLFFINSFFIALSTFLIIKYLRFPQKKYLDPVRAKMVKRYITIFSIIVIIPSVIIALHVVQETSFYASANKFINEVQEMPYFEHSQLISSKKEYKFKEQTIQLSVVGKEITPKEIAQMQSMLHKQYGLENTTLIVKQTDQFFSAENENELIEKILERKDAQLVEYQQYIEELESELAKLNTSEKTNKQVAQELAVQYPSITSFSVVKMVYTDTRSLKSDTIPTLFIESKQKLSDEQKQQLLKWLRVRLDEPKLRMR
jgi:uncharacterized hydrophobic protein (TIGR00271 family)